MKNEDIQPFLDAAISMGALEIWLFGSRGRGDHTQNSDYDLLVVFPDKLAHFADNPVPLWRATRTCNVPIDAIGTVLTDFLECQEDFFTLNGIVHREGVRLYPDNKEAK